MREMQSGGPCLGASPLPTLAHPLPCPPGNRPSSLQALLQLSLEVNRQGVLSTFQQFIFQLLEYDSSRMFRPASETSRRSTVDLSPRPPNPSAPPLHSLLRSSCGYTHSPSELRFWISPGCCGGHLMSQQYQQIGRPQTPSFPSLSMCLSQFLSGAIFLVTRAETFASQSWGGQCNLPAWLSPPSQLQPTLPPPPCHPLESARGHHFLTAPPPHVLQSLPGLSLSSTFTNPVPTYSQGP